MTTSFDALADFNHTGVQPGYPFTYGTETTLNVGFTLLPYFGNTNHSGFTNESTSGGASISAGNFIIALGSNESPTGEAEIGDTNGAGSILTSSVSLLEIEVRDDASGSVADSNATRFLADHLSWLQNNDPIAVSALTCDMMTEHTPISANVSSGYQIAGRVTLNVDGGFGSASAFGDSFVNGSVAAGIAPSADSAVAEACYVIGDGSEAILTAEPYVTAGPKWGPAAVGTTGGTVTWSIVGAGFSNATGNSFFTGTTVALSSFLAFDFTTVLTQAFAAWSAVANINFVQVADGGGNLGVGTNGTIRICGGFIDGNTGTNILAYGKLPGTNPRAGDIAFDSSNTWNANRFLSTALHEIGHAWPGTFGGYHRRNVRIRQRRYDAATRRHRRHPSHLWPCCDGCRLGVDRRRDDHRRQCRHYARNVHGYAYWRHRGVRGQLRPPRTAPPRRAASTLQLRVRSRLETGSTPRRSR